MSWSFLFDFRRREQCIYLYTCTMQKVQLVTVY
nr:MAG TPA: hypothetical protein [Caudoviricetes sp.]